MKKPDFLFLLLGASFAAFKATERVLMKKLVPEFRYNVYLNMSFDVDNEERKQFNHFPEDDGKIINGLTDKEVMNLLCREKKLPVWIDITVQKINDNSTTFELLCAGRYSDDINEFYYQNRGSGPFGIKIKNDI